MMISPLALVVTIILLNQNQGYATEYIVGDTFWSIPTTDHFYDNWSSSHTFQIGDTLFFEFDPGLHDVMQVSAREYRICSSDHPFEFFRDGPARVALTEEGVFYFICSIANYCNLGQKLSVAVRRQNNRSSDSSPAPSLSPGPSGRSHPFSSDDGLVDCPPFPLPDGSTVVGGFRGGGGQSGGGVLLAWLLAWFAALHTVLYSTLA